MDKPEETVDSLGEAAWRHVDAGECADAERAFACLCELTPLDSEVWEMRGAMLLELGDQDEAEKCLSRALDLDAALPDTHYYLGRLAWMRGDITRSVHEAQRATELDSDFMDAWLLLGAGYLRLSKAADAVDCFKNAQSLGAPPTVNLGLGEALLLSGDALRAGAVLQDALGSGVQAIQVYPLQVRVLRNLGQRKDALELCVRWRALDTDQINPCLTAAEILLESGEPRQALDWLSGGSTEKTGAAKVHNLKGLALTALGDFAAAESEFRQALRLENDDYPDALSNLGSVLQARGCITEALTCYATAAKANPDDAKLALAECEGWASVGKLDRALLTCERILERNPAYVAALASKAIFLERRGRYVESLECADAAIQRGGSSVRISLARAKSLLRIGELERSRTELDNLLLQSTLGVIERQAVYAALSEVCDSQGDYERAFISMGEAKRNRESRFDRAKHARYVDRLMATFDSAYWATVGDPASENHRPIFIVGMPRSGTSLVEQILATHSQVHGAGELTDFHDLALALRDDGGLSYPRCVPRLSRQKLNSAATAYESKTAELCKGKSLRVTDKLPHNYLHIGLIHTLYPRASIVHVVRDARDVCLSCFQQNFNSAHGYTYDLYELGRYYRLYEKLMAHWYRVLPQGTLHTVSYENLVEHFEPSTSALLAYCGLAWEAGLENFHQYRRDVATPSYDQVRKPLYRKSIGRWRHYAPWLAELERGLAENNEGEGLEGFFA